MLFHLSETCLRLLNVDMISTEKGGDKKRENEKYEAEQDWIDHSFKVEGVGATTCGFSSPRSLKFTGCRLIPLDALRSVILSSP